MKLTGTVHYNSLVGIWRQDGKVKMVLNLTFLKLWLEKLEASGKAFWENIVVTNVLIQEGSTNEHLTNHLNLSSSTSPPEKVRKGPVDAKPRSRCEN